MKRSVCIICLVLIIGVFRAAAVSSGDTESCFGGPDRAAREEVLVLVNRERARKDLPPLECDGALSAIAQDHAEDMARRGYFDHFSPEGKSHADRLRAAGVYFRCAAENIAFNHRGPKSVVNLWMGSTGHRRNILRDDLTKVGIGSYNRYYVLLLVGD